jgi:hypothetical protein
MKKLVTFGQVVAQGIEQAHRRGGWQFFKGVSVDPKYAMLPAKERQEKIDELTSSLPQGPNITFRGSVGTNEAYNAATTNRLGIRPQDSKKSLSISIPAHIEMNNSALYYSETPCSKTVIPYTGNVSLVPTNGTIIAKRRPQICVLPQKLLYLHEKTFDDYDKWRINAISSENPENYQSIKTMTRNNNEITAVLGASRKDDWRQNFNRDVHSIYEVVSPGRWLGLVMPATEPAHITHWQNPDFTPQPVSVEIVSGSFSAKDLAEMNEKATEIGMPKDERLLTLEDASAIMESGVLEKLDENYVTTETLNLSSVPQNIAIGNAEALAKYISARFTSQPNVTERERPPSPTLEI